jgi:hypothetical protein
MLEVTESALSDCPNSFALIYNSDKQHDLNNFKHDKLTMS